MNQLSALYDYNYFDFIFRYYSGEKIAPILTIFIGGNHEASNYLQELAYGGWVAPNIYYLGYAGVISINDVRIGGISGIFRGYNFEKGHFEFPPYDQSTVRSAYSIRSLEVFRLSQLTNRMDIMLSHDWPDQIWEYGNKEQLLRFKPYFREDMENGRMGSGPCFDLLTTLKPRHWYAAHLHCRFDALVPHNEDEATKFTALDKCLPKRKFLDFLTIGEDDEGEEADSQVERKMPAIKYDLQWLTVLHLTNNLLNVGSNYTKLPLQPGPDDPQDNVQRFEFTPSEAEMDAVLKKFNGDLTVPQNFTQTVPAYDPQQDGRNFRNLNERIFAELNPQTTEFCAKLGIDDPLYLAAKFVKVDLLTSTVNLATSQTPLVEKSEPLIPRAPLASFLPQPKFGNEEEIDLDALEDNSVNEVKDDTLPMQDVPKSEPSVVEEKPEADLTKPVESIASHVRHLDESDAAAVAPKKKFKRRNQEIYNAVEDE